MAPTVGTARDVWNDYFSKRQPKPADVGSLIFELHQAGRHQQVIAAIEAAIANGQSQPWMYEVLALSMQIVGRPQAEVERALLSQVDFAAVDVPNLLYSAAYLTRFGADRQALHLYRQASQLQPSRPEPYVLGLKLAVAAKDPEAIGWAATGVLTYAWGKGREQQHRDAEVAAEQAHRDLMEAGETEAAEALQRAMQEARKRDLIVKLSWSGQGELDLIVEEPLGTLCSFENPFSAGGGVLVHDGYGPNPDNCYEEYVCTFGAPGTYNLRVRHVSGNIVGKRARLTIVRYAGTPYETTRTSIVPVLPDDQSVLLSLKRGRRNELRAAPKLELTAKPKNRSGARSLRARIGRADRGAANAAAQFAASRQVPFVTGAQPVVGSSAVGFQPVVQFLSEGVSMSALAVISGDRRYVRITTAPSFSSITDVFTFSFVGSQ